MYNFADKNQVQMKLQSNINLRAEDTHHYLKAMKHIEDIALYLKPFSTGNKILDYITSFST